MSKKLIIIAEDEVAYAKILKRTLEKEGFSVAVVSNGDELLRVIRTVKSVVIILDLVMPLKNGFQVLTEMKKDKNLQKIPVIALSNLAQKEGIEKVKNLGANAYIVKTDETFHDVIRKIKQQVFNSTSAI